MEDDESSKGKPFLQSYRFTEQNVPRSSVPEESYKGWHLFPLERGLQL